MIVQSSIWFRDDTYFVVFSGELGKQAIDCNFGYH